MQYNLDSISDGVKYLGEGYIEYAQEVITDRALPDVYDGLKPVNRRIVFALSPIKSYIKCFTAVGKVGELHPHGDASIYAALVLMTQANGSLAFPLLDGNGNFGGFYKTDPPAASRYPEVKIHTNASEYFGEMNGIDMVPTFDSTSLEPKELPVSFPAVLVNATSGIAVGFKADIPSFNFVDVCNLVIEYLKKGQCSTIIYPDFVSGGYYIKDDEEAKAIMTTGKGHIKLRGKCVKEDKDIKVTEVPYGKTIQGIIKQINDAISDKDRKYKKSDVIKNAYDTDDYEHHELLDVVCTARNKVDQAEQDLYQFTDMQYTYFANITVIKDGEPQTLGVWDIIKYWTEWRKSVLTKEYTVRIDNLHNKLKDATAFMNIIKDEKKKLTLIDTIVKQGRDAGKQYIKENFTREEVPEDEIDFVASRPLPDYYKGGSLVNVFEQGKTEIGQLQEDIKNIDSVIISQMKALIKKYSKQMKRRTEITENDLIFTAAERKKVVDTSACYYVLNNGFILKLKGQPDAEKTVGMQVVKGNANDTLIAFDSIGRLMRIYGNDLAYSSNVDVSNGRYIPDYCSGKGAKASDVPENYQIYWIGKITGKELMLLYKDGNIGFVDTKEWDNSSRNVKLLNNGISSISAPYLGAVIEDIPEVLYVTDEKGRLAWIRTSELIRKKRTARTRVVTLKQNILLDTYMCVTEMESMAMLDDLDAYKGNLKKLHSLKDFHGDITSFKSMFSRVRI